MYAPTRRSLSRVRYSATRCRGTIGGGAPNVLRNSGPPSIPPFRTSSTTSCVFTFVHASIMSRARASSSLVGGGAGSVNGCIVAAPHVRETHETELTRVSGYRQVGLDHVEHAHAFRIERMRADVILARQQRELRQRQPIAEAIRRDPRRRDAVHVGTHTVHRGAVGTHDADHHRRHPV